MNGYRSHIFELHNLPGGLYTSWVRKGVLQNNYAGGQSSGELETCISLANKVCRSASFVPIEEDQLLTEQGIFDNKVRATAGHVR